MCRTTQSHNKNLQKRMAEQTKKAPNRPTTQRYLDMSEVRDDVISMKDGTLRAVVVVSSINFALKSEDEQQAIVQGYMQFLNGLEFPLQVVIQSRKMRIDDYIGRMRQAERDLQNELLRTQMNDYIQFIQDLVEGGEIMSKQFYVVVQYDPSTDKKKNFWTRAREVISPARRVQLNEKQFEERAHKLEQTLNHVVGGLNSMGLTSVRLDTQGLIELLYDSYNPVLSSVQPMTDIGGQHIETSYGF